MSLLNRLERYLGRFAIPHFSLYLVIGQVLFLGLALLGEFDLERIALLAGAVREGEIWRVFTYLAVPSGTVRSMTGAIFLAFKWYIFYLMGSALESLWGDFRYNAYIFIGWALTAVVAFIFPAVYVTNVYILYSVYFAFAWVNPDFEFSIYGIIPVKVKWLALILGLYCGLKFAAEGLPGRLVIVASAGNLLVFFGREIMQRFKTGRRQLHQKARRAEFQDTAAEPRHRCHKCGKTDLTHPQLDFRYCSKCAGDECYCSEHIANHEHTVAVAKKS